MKVVERVLEKRIRCQMSNDNMRLASCLAREPHMLFSSCAKYKRNIKQIRRICTMHLWICIRHLIESRGMS